MKSYKEFMAESAEVIDESVEAEKKHFAKHLGLHGGGDLDKNWHQGWTPKGHDEVHAHMTAHGWAHKEGNVGAHHYTKGSGKNQVRVTWGPVKTDKGHSLNIGKGYYAK